MLRSTLTLAASVLALSANAAEEQYNLDPAHTYPHFAVSHAGFSTMYGRFDATTGTLTMDRGAKTLSVSVEIEAKSIGTGHAKRDDHLRSPDFFNVAEHPKLTFKSTGSKWEGDRPVEISGDLTLVGVTRPVTLAVAAFKCGDDPWKNFRCGADASTSFKRSDFGMKYGVPGIGDDIRLMFEIEAVRQ